MIIDHWNVCTTSCQLCFLNNNYKKTDSSSLPVPGWACQPDHLTLAPEDQHVAAADDSQCEVAEKNDKINEMRKQNIIG